MDAPFLVSREPPEESEGYAISSPRPVEDGTGESEHDRLLRERALQMMQKDPGRKHVCVDRDCEELRIGDDRNSVIRQTASATDNSSLQRIYFHQLKDVSMGSNYVRIETKSGLATYFSGSTASRTKLLFDLLQQQVANLSTAAKPSSGKEERNLSSILQVPLFLFAFCVIVFHLALSPFTKVEESFNVQASHDLLVYPLGAFNRTVIRTNYDHIEFPGVVPRTFWGPLVLTGLYSAIGGPKLAQVLSITDDRVMDLVILRLVLGMLFLLLSTYRLFVAAKSAFPQRPLVPLLFVLLTMVQFHIPFYATRLLPNTLAMILTSLAHAELLERRHRSGLAFMIVTAVIVRCDVIILLGPTALFIFVMENKEHLNNPQVIVRKGLDLFFFGLAWFLISLTLSALVDSHFWDQPTPFFWPEGMVLFFNTVLNKSSQWGTQPFHWYFTAALPRSLMIALPTAYYGLGILLKEKHPSLVVFGPAFVFPVLYSLLPHKEVRFLFPVLPAWTLAGAIGVDEVLKQAKKHSITMSVGIKLILSALLLLCLSVSVLFSIVSSLNYPGGEALRWLHAHEPSGKVHIDAYSAMNGVSRFGYSPRFEYSKQEDDNIPYERFDFLLTHNPNVHKQVSDLFDIIYVQKGEPRFVLPSTKSLNEKISVEDFGLDDFIRTESSVFVMKRKQSHSRVA